MKAGDKMVQEKKVDSNVCMGIKRMARSMKRTPKAWVYASGSEYGSPYIYLHGHSEIRINFNGNGIYSVNPHARKLTAGEQDYLSNAIFSWVAEIANSKTEDGKK